MAGIGVWSVSASYLGSQSGWIKSAGVISLVFSWLQKSWLIMLTFGWVYAYRRTICNCIESKFLLVTELLDTHSSVYDWDVQIGEVLGISVAAITLAARRPFGAN